MIMHNDYKWDEKYDGNSCITMERMKILMYYLNI